MKTMTVAIEVLSVKVSVIFLDGLVEDTSWKILHYLGENVLAFVPNLELEKSTKLGRRSLQIVKCQRTG